MGTDMQGLSLTGSTEASVFYDRAWVISCASRPKWSKHKRQPVLPTPDVRWPASFGRTFR